jgi:signal-transduction protein with cAMP-binding, CBS, and nucleotidyltransferase domain
MMRNMSYIVAGLSDADMIWLLSMGKLRKLKPGERLVAAGRPVKELFFILGGSLEVRLANGTRVAAGERFRGLVKMLKS